MLKGCSFRKICTSYVRVVRIMAFNETLRKVNLGRKRSFSVIKQERCFTCSRELALTFQGLKCPSSKFSLPSQTLPQLCGSFYSLYWEHAMDSVDVCLWSTFRSSLFKQWELHFCWFSFPYTLKSWLSESFGNWIAVIWIYPHYLFGLWY